MNAFRLLFGSLLFLLVAGTSTAQRFAYIDTEYILENIPEYQEAQNELDALSKQWQATIEAKYAEIEEMKRVFKAEKILMTDDMVQKKEAEIKKKEQEALEYQKKKFGLNGELFEKRKELVQPLQEKIYNAMKELAERGNYAVIFDKASDSNILYSDEKYDKSDQILKKLGYQTETR